MGINEIIQIGNRIKMLRKEKGLSQREMAIICNIPVSTYSNYENNNREPSIAQLEKIADALEVPLVELLGISQLSPNNQFDTLADLYDAEYYITPETKEVAQAIYENKELSLLFDAAKDADPEDLKTVHDMLLALKRKERRED